MPDNHEIDHRDRRGGLILFGALQILIGLGCAALVPLTLLTLALTPHAGPSTVIPSLLTWAVAAAIFLILGIGSIRARCWARSFSLSLAWIWLITGALSLAVLCLAAPGLWSELAAPTDLDPVAGRVVVIAINLVLAVILVVVPAAMVLFYRSPHVDATCRELDPADGWAQRLPQRVLSLAIAYALLGLSVITMPSYGWIFPFFGVLLSGPTGAALWMAAAALCFALAWGTAKRERWAWWTGVVGSILAAASCTMTFVRVDADAVFSAMNLPPELVPMMAALWPRSSWVHAALWSAAWGSLVVYLIAVRGLFRSQA